MSLDAVVSSGGAEWVSSGGVASGVTVLSGGTLSGAGNVEGLVTVTSGAAEFGVTVMSGGTTWSMAERR